MEASGTGSHFLHLQPRLWLKHSLSTTSGHTCTSSLPFRPPLPSSCPKAVNKNASFFPWTYGQNASFPRSCDQIFHVEILPFRPHKKNPWNLTLVSFIIFRCSPLPFPPHITAAVAIVAQAPIAWLAPIACGRWFKPPEIANCKGSSFFVFLVIGHS